MKSFTENPYTHNRYYGDIVRRLFLGGAILMLVTLPFLNDVIPVPLIFSLVTILGLGLVAGFMNPRRYWIIVVHGIIASGAVLTFEYYAVDAYRRYAFQNILFPVNQTLALIFLVALYYTVKTARSLKKKDLLPKELV